MYIGRYKTEIENEVNILWENRKPFYDKIRLDALVRKVEKLTVNLNQKESRMKKLKHEKNKN